MLSAEKSLLLAVRDRLRLYAPYDDTVCQIEHDEFAPATNGNTWVVVQSGGWQPGPVHTTSGQVSDFVYAVDITVVKRITHVPRDRTRNPFLVHFSSLTEEFDKIFPLIDWSQDLMVAANAQLVTLASSTEVFTTPLRFTGMDRRPRIIGAEYFGGQPGEPRAGLARSISFGGARRITVKTWS